MHQGLLILLSPTGTILFQLPFKKNILSETSSLTLISQTVVHVNNRSPDVNRITVTKRKNLLQILGLECRNSGVILFLQGVPCHSEIPVLFFFFSSQVWKEMHNTIRIAMSSQNKVFVLYCLWCELSCFYLFQMVCFIFIYLFIWSGGQNGRVEAERVKENFAVCKSCWRVKIMSSGITSA